MTPYWTQLLNHKLNFCGNIYTWSSQNFASSKKHSKIDSKGAYLKSILSPMDNGTLGD